GATAGVGADVRRRERGPGLIGRTGSKDCVSRCSARFCCDPLTVTVGCAVSLGCAVADVVGEADTAGLSIGEVLGVSVGAWVAAGVGRGVVRFFFFGFGVGVDRTKSFLSLSPSVSSFSCVARVTATLIASAVAIRTTKRSFFFTRDSSSQLL